MGALVCGALLAAAGVACAKAGTPRLAASKIAAIEPGVAVLLFTLVPFSAQNCIRKTAHTARFLSCIRLLQLVGQTPFQQKNNLHAVD